VYEFILVVKNGVSIPKRCSVKMFSNGELINIDSSLTLPADFAEAVNIMFSALNNVLKIRDDFVSTAFSLRSLKSE